METLQPNWDNVFPEGKTYPGNVAPLRRFENISPGFLHTTGARLVAGRELTADDVANNLGTINYEVVSRINPQLPRVVV